MESVLLLADGRSFRGRAFGARGIGLGEVVFNTGMTGYQEVLTDPSYAGQMVCMTQPLIGNYGVNSTDVESRDGRVYPSGFVVRELSAHYSNGQAENSLDAYLRQHEVVGIDGLDTRALTRHLRDRGAMVGAIAPAGTDPAELRRRIEAWGSMEGRELASEVSCGAPYTFPATGEPRLTVSAWDYGAKQSIFRQLAGLGVTVHVFPARAPADELLERDPDGIFLSNGPGDPAACDYAVASVGELLGQKPLFGICLGHQILALALGATTYKLPFGHHGSNHPVQQLDDGRVQITSHNHGFAVDDAAFEGRGIVVTHRNLNDGSVEGLSAPAHGAFSVQYHPEASPGPHDAFGLFEQFVLALERGRS